MPLTLREILTFDALRAAAPELLAGADGLDRPVRWVHSSEIYEIFPLLSGGELLLTTGLGLAGADAGARRHYVREIAERQVAAVALELGRSFVDVPAELVDEARRHDMPLLALHHVVPFIRIAETVNTAIVEHRTQELRLAAELSADLDGALAAGTGVAGLLDVAAATIRAPLVLVSAGGALVAAHGVDDDRAAWAVTESSAAVADVPGPDGPRGRLAAATGSPLPGELLQLAVRRVAVALAIAMGHDGSDTGHAGRARGVLAALVDGTVTGTAATVLRGSGFGTGQGLLGVAVDAPDPRIGTSLVDAAARTLGTPAPALRAAVHGLVLGVLAVGPDGDPVGSAESAIRAAVARAAGGGVMAAVGPAVAPGDPAADLGRSVRTARSALDAAAATGASDPVTTSRALALELTLGRLPAPTLDTLVTELIGPLVEHDRKHRGGLVRTLDVYLRHGCSPTRAAAVLHVGRQSLYQRLERIEAVLGYPVTDAASHGSLVAATAAYRLRSGADRNGKSSA